jgi:hypothetical protein
MLYGRTQEYNLADLKLVGKRLSGSEKVRTGGVVEEGRCALVRLPERSKRTVTEVTV